MAHDADLRVRLDERLAAHPRIGVDDAGLRHAAVAVAVSRDDAGSACFLLTRRAASLRAHSYQWALPGGRVDPGETAAEAACRELHEELGVDDVEVLGELDDYATRSGYRITPVVVWVAPGAEIVPEPAEVAEAHAIPLAELNREDAPWIRPIPESDRPIIQMPIRDNLIHAPTAAVLYQFREVALHGRTTRVSHYDQPPFAWR